jgi:hypothetical protein
MPHPAKDGCPKFRYRRSWQVIILVILLTPVICGNSLLALTLPEGIPGFWKVIGRIQVQTTANSVLIAGGYVMNEQSLSNAEISFRARAPIGVEQVQIWGSFRCRDRDSRYVFALRGGNDNDVYLARYAPDGGAKFLGFAPLDFKPVPGIWYRLRVIFLGNRIQIYLNEEKLPRINVVDDDATWTGGGIALGGGWLPAEFSELQTRSLTDADQAAFLAMGNAQWTPPTQDKEALRQHQRSAYVPATFPALNSTRTELSLSGGWLFKPDYEMPAGETPVQLDYDDQNWHVMQVPSFWTPGLSWLHGETNFQAINEFSMTKGVAESLAVQETRRCDAYTFDWRKTRGAWYRHYINLQENPGDRHFELCFDAIAKVSEIWVNGTPVGTHTGMFGQVKCDVTKAIRPGANVITVHVTSRRNSGLSPNQVEGVAVTVEVTSSMLHSLPHGMFQDDVGGIWQPVKLTATAPVLIRDCFIEPGLKSAGLNLDILNSSSQPATVDVGYSITSVSDGSLLYSNPAAEIVATAAGEARHLKLATPVLNPKLWSPQDPNLYDLDVFLKQDGTEIDSYEVPFGFRTFSVEGDRLLLNGKPFRIRGANPFPNTLRPNDPILARKFMETARAGNVGMTRSHIVPFTSTWLDAADQTGVAVSFEGTWPWLMLEGNPPDDDLIKTWRDEFISLIKEYRNHPSILLWTVNNEMKFEVFDQDKPELLKRKWRILNETIREMRKTDPTRPIVADSSYVRKAAQKSYHTVVKPEGLDDGDIDDAHHYYGWYNESFFHFYNGEYDQQTTPGRPLISQEMATGYPNNDDGHPVRFYLFKHYTPQALVGDDAYENADPAIFLSRQAFMTKELAETLRRTGHDGEVGSLFFSYLTWFQTPWSASQIKPWPAYYALKTALQPVLVSAELYGRHFYAGVTDKCRVCVVNDSEDGQPIAAGKLIWEFKSGERVLSSGQANIGHIDYCQNRWQNVDFVLPHDLPAPRVDAELCLSLEAAGGKLISENQYDVTIASPEWAAGGSDEQRVIQLWDPARSHARRLFNIRVTVIESLDEANATNILVVGELHRHSLTAAEQNQFRNFVSNGGHVLMLHPGFALPELYPDQVGSFTAKEGEIVSMHVPESPVFSGIHPLDIAWFERGKRRLPLACTGVFSIMPTHGDVTGLAWQCDLHGYLKKSFDITSISGSPLVEIQSGKGRLLASELYSEAAGADPIARRILMNSIHYLCDRSAPPF